MGSEKPEVHVELAAVPGAGQQARAVVDRVAAGLPGDVGFRARLVAGELVANSVQHAAGASSDRVALTVLRSATGIRGEVRDRGAPFDDTPRLAPERATSGRGLRLVDALVDRWGAEHEDGNLVWFEIDAPSGGDDDPRSTPSAGTVAGRSERESLTAWTEQAVLARALLARAARRIRIGWCQGTDVPFIELVANFGCGLGSLLVGLSAQSQHLDTEPTAPPATASPSSPRYDRTAAAILDAAAHAFAEHGAGANMAEVAAAAGVGRATLYRYYPSRETLLQALAAKAIADAAGRIADAGLDRCPVPEAIERIVRALLAVGDRYVVLLGEQVEPDPDESERLVGTPLRAVFARGIEQGVLRDDLPPEDLQHLFGGLLVAAIKLVGERRLGLEETAAATTALFLDGARTPERTPGGG